LLREKDAINTNILNVNWNLDGGNSMSEKIINYQILSLTKKLSLYVLAASIIAL
jgi:hypothetical protein